MKYGMCGIPGLVSDAIGHMVGRGGSRELCSGGGRRVVEEVSVLVGVVECWPGHDVRIGVLQGRVVGVSGMTSSYCSGK